LDLGHLQVPNGQFAQLYILSLGNNRIVRYADTTFAAPDPSAATPGAVAVDDGALRIHSGYIYSTFSPTSGMGRIPASTFAYDAPSCPVGKVQLAGNSCPSIGVNGQVIYYTIIMLSY